MFDVLAKRPAGLRISATAGTALLLKGSRKFPCNLCLLFFLEAMRFGKRHALGDVRRIIAVCFACRFVCAIAELCNRERDGVLLRARRNRETCYDYNSCSENAAQKYEVGSISRDCHMLFKRILINIFNGVRGGGNRRD